MYMQFSLSPGEVRGFLLAPRFRLLWSHTVWLQGNTVQVLFGTKEDETWAGVGKWQMGQCLEGTLGVHRIPGWLHHDLTWVAELNEQLGDMWSAYSYISSNKIRAEVNRTLYILENQVLNRGTNLEPWNPAYPASVCEFIYSYGINPCKFLQPRLHKDAPWKPKVTSWTPWKSISVNKGGICLLSLLVLVKYPLFFPLTYLFETLFILESLHHFVKIWLH